MARISLSSSSSVWTGPYASPPSSTGGCMHGCHSSGCDTLDAMRVLPIILFLCCHLAAGVSVAREPVRDKASRPDVFLITIDTLRADHVHCYGYDRIRTPALDLLAKEGIRFTQAFTPSPVLSMGALWVSAVLVRAAGQLSHGRNNHEDHDCGRNSDHRCRDRGFPYSPRS